MEIIRVTPRGYCQGVVRAIEIVKKTAKENPNTKITMLGMIVHNKFVVEACNKLGVHSLYNPCVSRLALLDEIDEGIVIFTAHGVSDEVYQKAKDKGLQIVDATCVDVKKTHDLVKQHIKVGDVIYIGKHNHPESEGTCGISNRIHLVTNIEEVQKLPNLTNVLITNQTTLSMLDIKPIIDACFKRFPQASLNSEICNATTIRQKAVLNLKEIDVLFVVGDPHSNNSNQLRNIGLDAGIKECYLIEQASDIQEEMIVGKNRIAVTSGSSTPTFLTNEVINYLEDYAKTHQDYK